MQDSTDLRRGRVATLILAGVIGVFLLFIFTTGYLIWGIVSLYLEMKSSVP